MAKGVRFVWKKDFMVNLRTSPEAFAVLEKHAARIAAAAGPGHKASSMVTRGGSKRRARVQITAETQEARRANSERQVLIRAMGSGSG